MSWLLSASSNLFPIEWFFLVLPVHSVVMVLNQCGNPVPSVAHVIVFSITIVDWEEPRWNHSIGYLKYYQSGAMTRVVDALGLIGPNLETTPQCDPGVTSITDYIHTLNMHK